MTTQLLNVYFYALYDEGDHKAHSGLAANVCSAAVRSDIAGNYIAPRYVTVHRVPELVGVTSEDVSTVEIMQRSMAQQIGHRISCDTCRRFGDCFHGPADGLCCCEEWESRV